MMRALLSITIGFCLASCVTTGESLPGSRLAALEIMLSGDPAEIEARAQTGSARDQLALSKLHRLGLRGAQRDETLAAAWEAKARAQRGVTPITTYTAGLEGKPGQVGLIHAPRYDVTAFEAVAVEICLRALQRGDAAPASVKACGGGAQHAKLTGLWAALAARH